MFIPSIVTIIKWKISKKIIAKLFNYLKWNKTEVYIDMGIKITVD